MEAQGLDPSRGSARLVPVVLPLLHGPAAARRGPAADQALEGVPPAHRPDPQELRARRSLLPPAPAPGAAAMGLRQPEDLSAITLIAKGTGVAGGPGRPRCRGRRTGLT